MGRIANPAVELQDAREAIRALIPLVKREYPSRYSLREIAETWGTNVTEPQLAALSRLNRGEIR